ncbi:clathrin heavy chain 1 [Thecamonas trahens ATCC 50062]|uniref:Clathrin heavy chain n=1 Tax=Thecamonas trahens ATCC 50062 TaxID=461836 RepID=A0A0L0DNA5_THETB|nr:clathrin heavy chain 1 [Thecamonas trahens ATCC 50062]KNC53501.1 clathrin heavy chain 1 [Thecamonas trahens ATCC 50062]|eukprot:XP_013761822.1 clathrin heavy chain 1 [Thecamonas trahens ATCC 50062]
MAATSELPIAFQELFKLTALGIKEESISFDTVTLESDKYICVRETVGGKAQVVMVDVNAPKTPQRINMLATAVLMNPEVKVLALRAENQLQIFNLDMKSMMKEYTMTEDVQFWKWVDVKNLAIVTSSSVYHWSMEGTSAPVKICDRIPELVGTQIISYRMSGDGKWTAVVGISLSGSQVVGTMQLYSLERQQVQHIPGHACAFFDFAAEAGGPKNNLFVFASRNGDDSKLNIVEIGREEGATAYAKKTVNVFFPPEAAADFPVSMQVSPKYNTVFLVTKFGYIHLYDIESGTCLYMNRISGETIFVTALHAATDGIIGINKKGQVLTVGVNPDTIVPYIQQTLGNVPLAVKWASRYSLPGADDLFKAQFQRLFAAGDVAGAARIAAQSPRGILRTPETIALFQKAPPVNNVPAILQYFNVLLETTKLNAYETMQLARPVVAQGKMQLLEQWLTEDKLECSEELGDLFKASNPKLALSVYLRAEVSPKVVQCLAETGQFDNIVVYAQRANYTPDWISILGSIALSNPDAAKDLALRIVQGGEAMGSVDVSAIVDVFARCNLIQQATGFLLEVLKPDREEDAALQTRLLEMSLVAAPQVADAILGNDMLSHYNRQRVAELCEKTGLFQRALENYSDIADITRILTSVPPANLGGADFLVPYFGKISIEGALAALDQMLAANLRQNLQVVIQIATKYSEPFTPQELIALFEKHKSVEGLFFYLGSIVNFSQDPDVHYKYIEAASKANQLQEVTRICRDSNCYDPERTKNFLKEAQLPDQLPLIIVCDRFDFVDELTRYLYANNMMKYIEIYIRQVNALRAPLVIGTLLDLDANEDTVRELVLLVKDACPAQELIDEVEKRSRLKLLRPWLEERAGAGATDAATFNALAKIYVETSNSPEEFLKTNEFYEPLVVGKFCEKREPLLAVVAYTKGTCDAELIAVTNENSLYKDQARYLVARADADLWATVLVADNEHRRELIDAVVQSALTTKTEPEKVSVAVKAFMDAELPNELIELLEKIVLDDSGRFAGNRNLQTLLIITAVKADTSRVREYIERLDKFVPVQIANICIGAELYEEAFLAFAKFDLNVEAVDVLGNYLKDLERATDFAKKVDMPEVWSSLAESQLTAGDIAAGVDAYIKADDASKYDVVITAANEAGAFADLVRFLQMARKKLRETAIETELCYAYARTEQLSDLEDFINGPHGAQILNVGERCFGEGLYAAAKILFNNISNYARLATTLVRLGEYQAAVDAASKANNIQTWKEVNAACVEQEKFRLARICGLHIIVNAEELDSLIRFYEARGHFDEIIALIEGGLGDERAHTGMFTELAILYSKYQRESLLEHLKMFRAKINVPKVLRACEVAHMWPEMVFLCVHYDEHDRAIEIMIEHSALAWEHVKFKDVIINVKSANVAYRAVSFYIDEQPMLLVDLLHTITAKVDPARVVGIARKRSVLALIKPWLLDIQTVNNAAVNEAVNELFIEEEDFAALRESIESHDAFDALELAVRCEKHELLEFRRIAALLYKSNGRWQQSLELSKSDGLFKDAMVTVADSGEPELAEDLLRFFVAEGNHECFAAALFTCYDLVKPDVVLELAWRNRIMDYMMPYMVQVTKDYTSKVDQLVAANSRREAVEAEQEAASAEVGVNMMMGTDGPALLTYPGAGGAAGAAPMGGVMNAGNYFVNTL